MSRSVDGGVDRGTGHVVKIPFLRMSRWSNRDAGLWMGAAWTFVLAAFVLLLPDVGYGGGSGLNVLIVANRSSSNSLEIANYYRLRRQVPPEQVLRIDWPGSRVEWSYQDFTNTLLNPLLAFAAQPQFSNQVHYVLLSMDIPYRVAGGQNNSTTAALFYGFKASLTNSQALENSYAMSEAQFTDSRPSSAPTNSFLTMMVTAESVETAKAIIDQGVASDGMFPTQTVWLVKSSDPNRNIRYTEFDNAIFDARLCDGYVLDRTNVYSGIAWTNLLGCQLGLQTFSVAGQAFIPGAIADNLTSLGGQIFENPGQTTLLEFMKAGASASYGTVFEPLASLEKFPNPLVYFYQSRGFSLAECYYQSVQQPFQGLFVGEPLAAPWRRTCSGGWIGITNDAVLYGETNLCISFAPDQPDRPVQRIDLFVDGRYFQTLTNIPPQSGNVLTVRLNGYPVSYTVPTNATLDSIASDLSAELNQPVNTNITKVTAKALGNRIELQSFAPSLPEGVFEVVDNDATFGEPRMYLAAPKAQVLTPGVSSAEWTQDGDFRMSFHTPTDVTNVVQASTNLVDWVPVSTNQAGGVVEFIDADTGLYSQRYYRIILPGVKPTPRLTALGINTSNQFGVRVTSRTNRPYVLQVSSDFVVWSDLLTNDVYGDFDYFTADYADHRGRYYRTRSGDSNDYAPVTVVGQTASGGNILYVGPAAMGQTVLWSSTNSTSWVPIYTYEGSQTVQMEAESSSGAGEPLTTQLRAARTQFLNSTAYGIRSLAVADAFPADGTIAAGVYLRLSVTKTNGLLRVVALTNNVPNMAVSNFVAQFITQVNNEPDLQQSDGLLIEDLAPGSFASSWKFNLRARAAGLKASRIQIALTSSPGLMVIPSTGTVALDANRADLLPRNHLYVRAGTSYLRHWFDLDTTTLAEGHHELTAVAYEGDDVFSETLKSIPVTVSNTTFRATLTMFGGNLTNLVDASFDLHVSANSSSIAQIQLFTTGGLYDSRTKQATATFTVNGPDLGVGEHPFYAVVTRTNGQKYRTAELKVTLIR